MRNGKYKKAIKPRLISCIVRLLSTPVASAGLSKIKATKRANTSNSTFSLASKHPSSTHFTLTQIAKEAGISRQSIYQNHFNNYDELIQYIHEMIDADIHSHIEQDLTTKDPITLFCDNIIPLLYSKRTWLRCLYTTAADPSWRSFLQITYGKWLKENISPTEVDLQMPKPFLQELFLLNILNIIQLWISQEFPTPPDIFKKQFILLLKTPYIEFVS